MRVRRRSRPLALVAACAATVAAAWVWACYGDNVDSVHFYGAFGEPKVDFGRTPQKWMRPGWNNEPRRGGTLYGSEEQQVYDQASLGLEGYADGLEPWEDQRPARFARTVRRARNLEARGELRRALSAYREIADTLALRSFVRDREELVSQRLAPDVLGYRDYLRDRYLIEFGNSQERQRATASLSKLECDERVRPHVDYAIAAAADGGSRQDRADKFQAVARTAPKDSRSEAAFMMVARAWLESRPDGVAPDAANGKEALELLLREFPRTRFKDNALGWLAMCRLRTGDRTGAVDLYVRQSASSDPAESSKGHGALAEIAEADGRRAAAVCHRMVQRSLAVTVNGQLDAAKELKRLFRDLTYDEALEVQRAVRKTPALVGPYLTFRIEDTGLSAPQERNLTAFATSCVDRSEKADPVAIARLAQLLYNSGRYRAGFRLARQGALATGETGDRSLYTQAACLSRLGRRSEAIRTFERLYARDPAPYLKQSTAEELALLHERYGNPVRAYELYREWGYADDAALLADAILTKRQLRAALAVEKDTRQRSILEFTLAMRHFRTEDYGSAHRILSSMPQPLRTRGGMSKVDFLDMRRYWGQETPPPIVDPLADVDALWGLRKKVESAKSEEARARALYAMVRYVHDRRNLMYYSPGLWEGRRATSFSVFWNPHVNQGPIDRKVRAYGYEHECYAHVVRLCEELVQRCPRSPLVPQSLYSAGVAAERLSWFNSWWEPESKGLLRKAVRTMERLCARYPSHALAPDARKYAKEWRTLLAKPDWGG